MTDVSEPAAETEGSQQFALEPPTLHPRRTPPNWVQEALARWLQLEGRVEFVETEHKERVAASLEHARALLDDPVPRRRAQRIANWWNGDRIEQTWAWLEQAEVDIVQFSNDRGFELSLSIALQRAAESLSADDPRRIELEKLAPPDYGKPAKATT